MYKSFKVRNFRCFSNLVLTGLQRINLITGVNNVGKTALLEALFLHCGAYNPELSLRLNAFRGIESMRVKLTKWVETPWNSLFKGFDISKKIELVGENRGSGRRVVWLKVVREREELTKINQFIQHKTTEPESAFQSTERAHILEWRYEEEKRSGKYYMIFDPKGGRVEPIPPSPPFPAFFQGARVRISLTDEAERFGKLETENKQDVLLRILQIIEPRLKRLAVVVVMGQPMIHGDVGMGRLIPLPVMGDGMVRLASLVLHLSNAQNGVVLIDEIEDGLHFSILSKVWRAIGQVAREFNTQVFATTHSLECIEAAHRAFTGSSKYDFRLYRLDRVGKTISVVSYDQETLGAAIETGLEVR